MKVLLYPGAFNPPHNGHMVLLRAAMERLLPDIVILLPIEESSGPGYQKVDAYFRRMMCSWAPMGHLPEALHKWVDVGTFEPPRKAKCYARPMVNHYLDNYPGADLWILLGKGGAQNALGWLEGETFRHYVSLILAREADPHDILQGRNFKVLRVNAKPSPITSAQVRGLLREGKSTTRYLAPRVRQMIQEHGLYLRRRPRVLI